MTPFSMLLSDLCRSRQVLQKQLAQQLNVDPSYLSALTSGRKGVPSDAILRRLEEALDLTDVERQTLQESVKISKRKYRVPHKAHPDFYAVAWQMFHVAENLSPAKLNVIKGVLEL